MWRRPVRIASPAGLRCSPADAGGDAASRDRRHQRNPLDRCGIRCYSCAMRTVIPTRTGVGTCQVQGRECGLVRFTSPVDGEVAVALDVPSMAALEAQLAETRMQMVAAALA